MPKLKFAATGAAAAALAATPIAFASGVTIKTTPTRAKVGQTVEMLIKGMKPGEKIKGKETLPFGQTRTIFPARAANHQGVILVAVKAQIKGKHTWVFTGRKSHRSGRTAYYVR